MNLGDDFELRFFFFCLDTIKTKLYNIRRLIESRYACIFTDGIIIESPISQVSIDEERRCITLLIIFVHIIAPVISGCAVAYYTYWLSKRNK
jgi:hypothetical protein